MLLTKQLVLTLCLLFSLSLAAPTPFGADGSIEELVARTRTAAKKQQAQAKRVIAKLDKKLKPPPNKAVFWSGSTKPKGASGNNAVIHHAVAHAKHNGKTTLETGLAKAKINMPNNSPQAPALWNHASKLWAQRAKGKTEAIVGHVRPGSVYKRIEKPALKKNPNVKGHREHNVVKKGNNVPNPIVPKNSVPPKWPKGHQARRPSRATNGGKGKNGKRK